MPIRRLSEDMVNRIAAGEVVERPASVVKELVENAHRRRRARGSRSSPPRGGVALIRVTDDGGGIAPRRPARSRSSATAPPSSTAASTTSASLGFRGEALAAIGAAARLSLASRRSGASRGLRDRGRGRPGRRRSGRRRCRHGTRVEVRDLFFATPARLKFLKSERAEAAAITEVVKRLAMAHPEIRFSLSGSDRTAARLAGGDRRRRAPRPARRRSSATISAPMRSPIDATREGVRLAGFAGLPTYSRANSLAQFLFVNGRPVRDKLLLGALRAAYADLLKRDRHPVAALFLDARPARRSTSTSTRPRPRSASAIPAWCAA